MRKLKILSLSILLLLVIAMLAFQSEWGKALALRFLTEALQESGYKAEIGQIGGTIPHAIRLKDVHIESDALDISIASLETRLSIFALLQKELLFTDLKANGISWNQKKALKGLSALGSPEKHLFWDGDGEGLTFTVRVKHFDLTDVAIPNMFSADLEGSMRVGKKNKDFYLDLTAKRSEFPESKVHATGYIDENGFMRLKGTLDTPTLQALPYHPEWDATAHLQFVFRGKENLSGRVWGIATPRFMALDFLRPYLEPDFKIAARVVRQPGKGWAISRVSATTDKLTINANADLTLNGHLRDARAVLKSKESDLEGRIELAPADEGAIRIKGNASCAKLTVDSIPLENVSMHTDLIWKDASLKGSGVAAAVYQGKPWKGKTDLSWTQGKSLLLTQAALQGPGIAASGNMELLPDKSWIGQTDYSIDSLHELPGGLYGKAQGKAEWMPEGFHTSGKAEDLYWNELFVENVLFDGSLKQIKLSGEGLQWRGMSLEKFNFASDIGIPSQGFPEKHLFLGGSANRPFTLDASGYWEHPLEFKVTGNWHYKDSDFTCSLQFFNGTFYNQPINLVSPVNFEISPETIHLSGLELTLANARLFLKIDKSKQDADAELIVERFPLEILPLDIPMSGRLDCTASLQEKNKKVSGALKASIGAAGKIEGTFDNEQLVLRGATPLAALDLSLPISFYLTPPRAELLYDRPANGHLVLNGKIEDLLDFFDLGTHRIAGNINCDLTLKNTLDMPEFSGNLHFENGYYENYLTGTRLLDIQAEGNADRDRFILSSFTASDGKGSMTAAGEISLHPSEFFLFQIDASFTRFNLAQIDLVTAEAEGKIHIAGNAKEATASGHIDVIQSDLHIPDRIPKPLPNLVVVYHNAIKPVEFPVRVSRLPYPLHLDMEVSAPEGVFIEGRGLNSEWKGTFHIGGTFTDLNAQGKLELIKGEFLFASRRFRLLDGALSFAGKEHEMPYLNLAAVMDVKDVSITARLKGPLNNPQLTLQSVPPLPMGTIMAYLLFGQDLAEINSFQALQLANSLASLAGQGPDVLESTRKALGVDQLNIVSVPSGDVDVEDTIALQVGKYVSEGVLVSFTQGAEDSSSNISIEVELKGGWIVQLESDQRQEQGKFTIKWNHNY